MYSIVYTKKVVNYIPNLKAAKLDKKAKALIEFTWENPYQTSPCLWSIWRRTDSKNY